MSKSKSSHSDEIKQDGEKSRQIQKRSRSNSSDILESKRKRSPSCDIEKRKKKKHKHEKSGSKRDKQKEVDKRENRHDFRDRRSRSISTEKIRNKGSSRKHSPDFHRKGNDRARRKDSPKRHLPEMRRSRSRDRGRRKESPRRLTPDHRRSRSHERKRRKESPRKHSPESRRSRSRDRIRRRESPKKHLPEPEMRRSRSRDRGRRKESPRRLTPDHRRSRSRERTRKKESPRKHSPEPRRSRSREKPRQKESPKRPSKPRRSRTRSRERLRPQNRVEEPIITPEERDERTVSCLNLSLNTSRRDLEEFFSAAGKVYHVRLLTDPKSHRPKGIAFIEFESPEAVPKALELDGQELNGRMINVRLTLTDRNKVSHFDAPTRPSKLFVSNLHPKMTEDVLHELFEAFGRLESVDLVKDERGGCKGFCYVQYINPDHAKRAMDEMNGYEVAGRELKVAFLSGGTGDEPSLLPAGLLDDDEIDRSGVTLGASARLQLMAKLAQGRGLDVPKSAQVQLGAQQPVSQTFLMSNVFDPDTETRPNWAFAVYTDVVARCRPHGGAVHVYVDRTSRQGHVYVKAGSQTAAASLVTLFHGCRLRDRTVSVSYLALDNYHQLFPDALYSTTIL